MSFLRKESRNELRYFPNMVANAKTTSAHSLIHSQQFRDLIREANSAAFLHYLVLI